MSSEFYRYGHGRYQDIFACIENEGIEEKFEIIKSSFIAICNINSCLRWKNSFITRIE
jgi:hypothetical protein